METDPRSRVLAWNERKPDERDRENGAAENSALSSWSAVESGGGEETDFSRALEVGFLVRFGA